MADESVEVEEARVFRPQVAKAKPRLRLGFVVALLLTLAAGVGALLVQRAQTDRSGSRAAPDYLAGCTALTVATTIKDPAMTEHQRVICLAIAGRIDLARTRLLAMPERERSMAVDAVFSVAHPIADAGDDRSAGPIMELVVELSPENYMAVFHAGMAEFALGDDAHAKVQLERFLTMYGNQDVWRERAQTALTALANRVPLDQRVAHFPE